MPAAAIALASIGAFKGAADGLATIRGLRSQELNSLQSAKITRELGKLEVSLFRRQAKSELGQFFVDYAAAGVVVDAGTPMDALMNQARNDASAEIQMTNARELQAYGFEQEAANAAHARKTSKRQMPFDILGGAMSMGSAGLSGGGGNAGFIGGS
jgi:hypothetical protein